MFGPCSPKTYGSCNDPILASWDQTLLLAVRNDLLICLVFFHTRVRAFIKKATLPFKIKPWVKMTILPQPRK